MSLGALEFFEGFLQILCFLSEGFFNSFKFADIPGDGREILNLTVRRFVSDRSGWERGISRPFAPKRAVSPTQLPNRTDSGNP